MERKSLKELSQLYDSGKVTTLQYIRSLEARVRQANGIPPAGLTDKERIAVAREYLSAKRARDYAVEELEAKADTSYPTDADEAQALGFHLADIRAAERRMAACLEKLS